MKSSFVFFLLLCGMAVCQIRDYIYIYKAVNWSFAQSYCRENYVDLATITTIEENQRLLKAAAVFNSSNGWIGLNRTAPGSKIWEWSDGEPYNFSKWMNNQPDNAGGVENCGMVYPRGWNDQKCATPLPFYCSWRPVLVQENKTWEEALHYCRTYHTGLATPISLAQLAMAKNITAQTQTVSVWTGLHFVNGQWVCVSRMPLVSQVSLTSCPASRYHCGAHNTKTDLWENRDCSEKLNFLCY